MKRSLLVALAALALPLVAQAQTSPATTGAPTLAHALLSKPYPMTQGDMVALTMTEYMPLAKAMNWGFDATVVACYDHPSGKIDVSVYGVRSSVDEAKAALEYFLHTVFPVLGNAVSQNLRVRLEETDLTLVYYDRTHESREIVRRFDGKYIVNN